MSVGSERGTPSTTTWPQRAWSVDGVASARFRLPGYATEAFTGAADRSPQAACPHRSTLHPARGYTSFEADSLKGALEQPRVHCGPSIHLAHRAPRCRYRLIGRVGWGRGGCI